MTVSYKEIFDGAMRTTRKCVLVEINNQSAFMLATAFAKIIANRMEEVHVEYALSHTSDGREFPVWRVTVEQPLF